MLNERWVRVHALALLLITASKHPVDDSWEIHSLEAEYPDTIICSDTYWVKTVPVIVRAACCRVGLCFEELVCQPLTDGFGAENKAKVLRDPSFLKLRDALIAENELALEMVLDHFPEFWDPVPLNRPGAPPVLMDITGTRGILMALVSPPNLESVLNLPSKTLAYAKNYLGQGELSASGVVAHLVFLKCEQDKIAKPGPLESLLMHCFAEAVNNDELIAVIRGTPCETCASLPQFAEFRDNSCLKKGNEGLLEINIMDKPLFGEYEGGILLSSILEWSKPLQDPRVKVIPYKTHLEELQACANMQENLDCVTKETRCVVFLGGGQSQTMPEVIRKLLENYKNLHICILGNCIPQQNFLNCARAVGKQIDFVLRVAVYHTPTNYTNAKSLRSNYDLFYAKTHTRQFPNTFAEIEIHPIVYVLNDNEEGTQTAVRMLLALKFGGTSQGSVSPPTVNLAGGLLENLVPEMSTATKRPCEHHGKTCVFDGNLVDRAFHEVGGTFHHSGNTKRDKENICMKNDGPPSRAFFLAATENVPIGSCFFFTRWFDTDSATEELLRLALYYTTNKVIS
ncbi:hypothetical protein TrLO_g12310 [Triparma laevis f. longispina]|uniref:Uncharacterized protein n=1 Tax=Triparma laevis f. longispina TaxID=1714387 RepID=A0A9W7FQW3_9STRA|nr:hypothetical protein TrLO_g12310 [Triparma laevis f. longispina]